MIIKSPREIEQENFSEISDSTVTNSSSCIDLLHKSRLSETLNKRGCHKSFQVGPKESLSQYLEMKYMHRNLTAGKKTTKESTKRRHFPGTKHFKLSKLDLSNRIRGGGDIKHGNSMHKDQMRAAGTVDEGEGDPADPQVFPFKSTPSGNFKLNPSQIVYESKDLSIVAADPNSVSLNITESEMAKNEKLDKDKTPFVDNWTTTCLYTTVGTAGLAYSDFETTDSDRGNNTSELSLAKMGYVIDNCIEWNDYSLPKKSDLKEILLHNILNMIYTDIQVKVGNKTYKCHKIVLQSYSTFFVSKIASQVELPESSVPGDVFSLVYQWMLHTNTDSYRLLRRDNILNMFKAAQYLGIKELEEQCWSFIDNPDIFCEDKAFLLYLEARKLKNKAVMELMVPRVQRFFLTLVSSKEFIEFNSSEVCTFLQSNYICVHCEEEVFMSGVRWLRHDWPHRKSYAIEIMACVRFGLVNPKLLLAIQRHMSSAEFKPIISIPEVGKMVDDGISIQMLKLCLSNDPAENIEDSKQKFNLEDPVPRNWAGTERCYQSYAEFIKDLSHYRSKQRLEVKKSRIKTQMEKVDRDDFLSSAVLSHESQQKIKRLHQATGLQMDCIPEKNYRERTMPRHIRAEEDRKRTKTSAPFTMLSEDYDACVYSSQNKQFNIGQNQDYVRENSGNRSSYEQQDKAARKIQKAYRNYSSRKSSSLLLREEAAKRIQKAYRQFSSKKLHKTHYYQMKGHKLVNHKSRSDPSLPSGLIRSSTNFTDKNKNGSLPLRLEKETVFIFGGKNPMDDNDESEFCIFQYDAECNEWRKCGEMPEPRHYHSIAYFQEKIYVAGGKHPCREEMEPGAVSRKVWRFDPALKTWSRIKDMLHARRSFSLVGCNNKLYVVGGRNEIESAMSKVERFDSASNSWIAVAPMHVARAGASVSEFKGKIWVAGGLIRRQPSSAGDECKTIATNSVEYYDWQHNKWVECTSLRYTLAYGVMVPVKSRIFIVGGAIGLQNTSLKGSGRQIDVWDSEAKTWCMATVMSKPRHAHTAVYLRNTGYMFIMGGINTQHECATDTVECWSVEDGLWITGVAPLPTPISGSAALVLPCTTFC